MSNPPLLFFHFYSLLFLFIYLSFFFSLQFLFHHFIFSFNLLFIYLFILFFYKFPNSINRPLYFERGNITVCATVGPKHDVASRLNDFNRHPPGVSAKRCSSKRMRKVIFLPATCSHTNSLTLFFLLSPITFQ